MIRYSKCPVCSDPSIHLFLPSRDIRVSGEWFEIWECGNCHVRFTQDAPDINEAGKYYSTEDYISHNDTRQGLVNRVYHFVRNITVNIKRKLVVRATGLQTGEVLDIGCGTGNFLAGMRASGWKVTGIEPDTVARNNAIKLHDIVPLPAESLFSLPDKSFHAITLWHVLEHLHDLHGYLSRIKSLLSPGGRIFIAVPNHLSFDARYYKQFWNAYDVPRHLYHFSPDSMRILLKEHGLVIEKMKPMWFDSVYVSLLSEKYKKGFAGPLMGFLVGLISNINAIFFRTRCSSLTYVIREA